MQEKKEIFPLIPLRGMTVFPNMVIYFDVGRKKSITAIEKAMSQNQKIFLAAQKDINVEEPNRNDIFDVGTVCKIKQIVKLPKNSIRVLVEGIERGKIDEYSDKEDIIEVSIENFNLEIDDEEDSELEAALRMLKDEFFEFLEITTKNKAPDFFENIDEITDANKVADIIAAYVVLKQDQRQELLHLLDVKERIKKLLIYIKQEKELIFIEKNIDSMVKSKIDKGQKEYYLREQLKVIQEQLGEDDENKKAIKNYEEIIAERDIPNYVKEKALYEISRLKTNSIHSQEGATIRSYLDVLLSLPWEQKTEDNIELRKAKNVLENAHYGLNDVKERIIEYLAVKKMSNSLRGPILCLVGPPGVGKTSIAKSIAKATNRNFVRMSLGGVKDESEIRGHRRTYVGAMPGRLVNGLKQAKSNNPLFLLDEIDKLGSNMKGNPADALLEVLDGEQNSTFRDHYLEVDLDLSKVMFITTANTLDTIPRPLLDRMEIIEVSGYTYEEKFYIAKKYLIPKKLIEHGIKKGEISISDNALKVIIEGYTRESGVRGLERVIATVIRKAITVIIGKGKKKINISSKMVEKYLGPRIFNYDIVEEEDKIGVVTGLAWTAYGGDTLPVEVMVMEGKGRLELTGQLGDVMKESAKAAYSYVRANREALGIECDFNKNKDIHIHVPEGAVPKDGPSAGVTMITALVSALSSKKVKHNVAMTGEITLTGRVLAIGGLKEKCLAASRMGIDMVIVPKENEKDLIKLPNTIKSKLKIILAEKIQDVLTNALIGEDKHEN